MDFITVFRDFANAQRRPPAMNDREVIRQTTIELRELQAVVTMLLGSLSEMQDGLKEAISLGEKAEQVIKWQP